MTYGNLNKNKIQNAFGSLFDSLSIERKLNDDLADWFSGSPDWVRRS